MGEEEEREVGGGLEEGGGRVMVPCVIRGYRAGVGLSERGLLGVRGG